MYQALYRKWRPQTFDEVVGQKHITETLKNQVITGRLSHAYIFIGTRGTGKTTCARILAKAVNCERPVNGNPCGRCPACLGISDGSIMDVVEMDAASNNKVDNVRALREEAVFSPSAVKKRVYIIDEVHMLTTSAFNALLKILEEPPEHLMFILATTELQKVPATILSRCQRHSFRRLETGDISDYLDHVAKSEGFDLTHDAAELIARLAEGGLRDALSLLDQCSAAEHIDVEAVYDAMGLAGNRRIAVMLEHILKHDTASAISDFSRMWMDGKDPGTFLREMNTLLRDTMITAVAPKSAGSLVTGGYDRNTLEHFASKMTSEEIISAMETVQRYLASLRDITNPRTAAELCLVSLCDSTAAESISSLRARISRLEEELESGVKIAVPPVSSSFILEPEIETEDSVPLEFRDPKPYYEQEPLPPYIPLQQEPVTASQPEHEPEPAPEPAPAPLKGITWAQLCADLAEHDPLPPDLKVLVNDTAKLTGHFEGSVLMIEVLPGFTYNRINKNEVLQKFASAAERLSGMPVRVLLSELKEHGASRSLDELKQYPEVKFN